MKRFVDSFLLEWKNRTSRKPLILRGARQVGKTYAIRELGKTFSSFVEVNLETQDFARSIIEKDMDPHRIVQQLSEILGKNIDPGQTLFFLDEIQSCPKAITTLRYFYELLPELHVVAAGSLLDFAIEQVGVPVGRVSTLYMYPLSFLEFLVALGHNKWAQAILEHSANSPINDPLHEKLLTIVGEYLAIGGMPGAVNEWVRTKLTRDVKIVHADLIQNYQQDFSKYAKRHQIKYLDLLFRKALEQLARKFVYSRVGEYKKRELEPGLELLEKAGLLYRVTRSAGQGIPLGAQADLDDFKIIFLDTGICQTLLNFDLTPWVINPLETFINKGELVEAFVGQELLAYSDPIIKESLFYWRREKPTSQAEVDYLVQLHDKIVPIEAKAGKSKHITSMHLFLELHPMSPYGIRFSTENYAHPARVHSYPLYAVAKPFAEISKSVYMALAELAK